MPTGFDLGDPGGLDGLRGSDFQGLGNFRGLRGSNFEGLRGSNFEGHVNELRGAMFYVCKVKHINFVIMRTLEGLILNFSNVPPHVKVGMMLDTNVLEFKILPINKYFRLFCPDDLIFCASCSICW